MHIIDTLGNKTAKHAYLVETNKGWLEVNANNRTQAASLATKAGYEVRSVNFEG